MTCNAHCNECSTHPGYVPARTVTFSVYPITTDTLIQLDNDVQELLNQLNTEATRRSVYKNVSPITLTLANPIQSSQIREIRDLFVQVVNYLNTPVSPITDNEIAQSKPILASTFQYLKEHFIDDVEQCACDCNYACTCDCNYCTCNCNYCTCNCNYCTCDCNYCTCNCNYCTCNCNYCCTCDCDYCWIDSGGGCGGYSCWCDWA